MFNISTFLEPAQAFFNRLTGRDKLISRIETMTEAILTYEENLATQRAEHDRLVNGLINGILGRDAEIEKLRERAYLDEMNRQLTIQEEIEQMIRGVA